MEKDEKAFVIRALRRASLRWPARTEAKKAARVERGKYTCAGCGKITRAKDVSVDHVAPTVDPETGFTTWDDYISRLFCARENLQCLCGTCHGEKTKQENARRREVARASKPKAKKRTRRRKKANDAGPPENT